MAGDLDELHVGQRREPALACARSAPGWPSPSSPCRARRSSSSSRCRRARGASPRRRPPGRAPRSIAVSSAMLLVPTPRYSPSSRRLPPSMTTTPIPIGPGFPEQAPSVHISSAAPAEPAALVGGLRRGLRRAGRAASARARRRRARGAAARRGSGFPAMDGSSWCRIRDTSSRRGRRRPAPAAPTRRRAPRPALP